MLKGFKLKKVECWAKRMAQPIQPVEDWLREAKNFLSPSGFLFPVKVKPQPVEAQRSLFLTASQPVDP